MTKFLLILFLVLVLIRFAVPLINTSFDDNLQPVIDNYYEIHQKRGI